MANETWKKWRPQQEPHRPVEGYDESVVYAFRALAAGEANDGQQKLVWQYMQFVCGVGAFEDMTYRPGGLEGDRATAFAEGKRFAGLQLLKMVHPATLEAVVHERDGHNRREAMRGKR